MYFIGGDELMKKFYEHNRILTVFAIGAFLNCMVFILTDSLPEIYPGLGDLYKLTYDLCLAYLGSLVFYIVQIYMVNEKKKQNMRKQLFLYLFSIHGELNSAKQYLKTLEIALNKDYETFKSAYDEVNLKNESKYETNLDCVFNLNIKYSVASLEMCFSAIEEHMKNIYSINISSVGSNFEFLDKKIQEWIERYRSMKAYRIKYHNGVPESEKVYYECMLSIVEGLYGIYSEKVISKEIGL